MQQYNIINMKQYNIINMKQYKSLDELQQIGYSLYMNTWMQMTPIKQASAVVTAS